MGIQKFLFKMLAACAGQAIKAKISNEDWQEKVIAEFGGTSVETVIDQISKKINSEKKAEERLESILKKSFSEINIKYDDKFAGAYELLKSTSTSLILKLECHLPTHIQELTQYYDFSFKI